MNTNPALKNQGKVFPIFEKKKENVMISKIDRKRIFIFVAIAYGISIALGLVIFLNGGIYNSFPTKLRPLANALMFVIMFAPMVAHIVTRLITREGWSNTFLRPNFHRGWPFYLAALFLPALATIVGAMIYYLLFPGRFDVTITYARDTLGLVPTVGITDPWTFIITQIPITIVLSIFTVPLMVGEEFGWRAYLLPKLMPLGGRKAVVLVCLIHGSWHWPLFLMGYNYGFDYWGAPVVGALLYLMIACYLGVLLAWVTLRSGSVWPAALAHGVINALGSWTLIFSNSVSNPLIGPQPVGIIGSLGFALLALLIFFNARALAQSKPTLVDAV